MNYIFGPYKKGDIGHNITIVSIVLPERTEWDSTQNRWSWKPTEYCIEYPRDLILPVKNNCPISWYKNCTFLLEYQLNTLLNNLSGDHKKIKKLHKSKFKMLDKKYESYRKTKATKKGCKNKSSLFKTRPKGRKRKPFYL